MIPDPIIAIRSFLKADAAVAALAGNRVWAGELPRKAVASMPEAAIVIRVAGGGLLSSGSYISATDIRVDLFCYGATPLDAFSLWRMSHYALRQMRQHVQGNAMLYWAKEAGGPNTLREPDTEWPLTLSSWQVLWSETEVA